MARRFFVALLAIAAALGIRLAAHRATGSVSAADDATLPDVPGAIATTDTATVCAPGYASRVRPRGREWRAIKRALRERAGLRTTYGDVGDHDIALELGGAPHDLRNIWLQPYSEAHAKDRVEDELHILVCDHRMSLTAAQQRIAANWTTAVPAAIILTPRERALLRRESTPDY